MPKALGKYIEINPQILGGAPVITGIYENTTFENTTFDVTYVGTSSQTHSLDDELSKSN